MADQRLSIAQWYPEKLPAPNCTLECSAGEPLDEIFFWAVVSLQRPRVIDAYPLHCPVAGVRLDASPDYFDFGKFWHGLATEKLQRRSSRVNLGMFLAGALATTDGFWRIVRVVDIHGCVKRFLVIGTVIGHHIPRGRETSGGKPLLQGRFRISGGVESGGVIDNLPHQTGHQLIGSFRTAVQEHCPDDRLEGVGEEGGFIPPVSLLFSSAQQRNDPRSMAWATAASAWVETTVARRLASSLLRDLESADRAWP